MKSKLLILALLPLFFIGCNDLFDKGDAEKVYDGPPQVAFQQLEHEVSELAGSYTLQLQLIAPHRDSPIDVNISVDESSTAEEGVHYNLITDTITIEPNSSTAEMQIEILDSGIFAQGNSVRLSLNIEDASGVEIAENLKQSNIFIQRFNRTATLSAQAFDLRVNDTNVLVEGVNARAGDAVVITTTPENGSFEGETIVGYTIIESNISGDLVAVDLEGASPTDYAAHVIAGSQVTGANLDNGVVSAETLARVTASSSIAPVYAVAQFEFSNVTSNEPINTVTVDVIEFLYEGSVGVDEISIDLHEVDEEGNIGAFIGISAEDLAFNQVYNNVIIDIVEAVEPGDNEAERIEDSITESGTFFAMAHLGAAGEGINGGRIPAQNPALLAGIVTEVDGDVSLGFVPVGDDAEVTIEGDENGILP